MQFLVASDSLLYDFYWDAFLGAQEDILWWNAKIGGVSARLFLMLH
jgi:hypothetical protein